MSRSPVHRVLVVGVGSIGERHLRCFGRTGRADVGLVEVNAAVRDTVAARYGVTRSFAELDVALAAGFDAAVVATLNLGAAIFAEAALSFLGVGVPPPTPSLGNMLGGVLAQSFQPPWWLVIFPGIAIAVTVLAANLLGDSLRDFLDPKLIARLG